MEKHIADGEKRNSSILFAQKEKQKNVYMIQNDVKNIKTILTYGKSDGNI